jgi:hypothetical protein
MIPLSKVWVYGSNVQMFACSLFGCLLFKVQVYVDLKIGLSNFKGWVFFDALGVPPGFGTHHDSAR